MNLKYVMCVTWTCACFWKDSIFSILVLHEFSTHAQKAEYSSLCQTNCHSEIAAFKREKAKQVYAKMSPPTPSTCSDGPCNIRVKSKGKIRFAVVGDCHGRFEQMIKEVEDELSSDTLDFVLQVGDIECHRDEEDLKYMAAPAAKRELGDFWRFKSGVEDLRWDLERFGPLLFIGGNHEPYRFLDGMVESNPAAVEPYSLGDACPGFYYLGRAGFSVLRFYDDSNQFLTLQLGFLSGIQRDESSFLTKRPLVAEMAEKSNKDWIGFNCWDMGVLLEDESGQYVVDSSDDSNSDVDRLVKKLRRALGLSDEILEITEADGLFLLRGLEREKRRLFLDKWRGQSDTLSLRTLAEMVASKIASEAPRKKAIEKLEQKLRRKRNTDILLTHDWPAGIVEPTGQGHRVDVGRQIGNEHLKDLMCELRPRLYCCGHMHTRYRREVAWNNGERTALACLGKVGESEMGGKAVAIFEMEVDGLCGDYSLREIDGKQVDGGVSFLRDLPFP